MSEETNSTVGTGSAAESLRMSYAHAKDAARKAYENVKGHATDCCEVGKEKATDYRETVEGQIRDNPMRSVLIAAGVGLLLGMMFRRR